MNESKFQDIYKAEKPTPSSVGSRADLKADVNIAKVHGGYFSNPEVAQAFVDNGVMCVEKELPANVKYADFGGGQGFLTKAIANWLQTQGHNVDAFVLDANQKFLDIAKNEGLKTQQCNLESCDFKDADLITMRAVNHYNPIEKQLEILESALKSLKEKGFLLSQISSGSKENCELRSEIVNLKSLGRAAEGESYHWTSVEEYGELLNQAGFSNIAVSGYAPDCQWTPEEQWDRFHEKETKEATDSKDVDKINEIKNRKEIFLKEAYVLIQNYANKYGKENLGVSFDTNGKAIIKYKYPIIRSQKK